MADIVGGLFGVTPQSLMQQQQQGINAEALQYAQLDPFQRATAGFYKAGAQLPGAVAGLMGVQDPQLAAQADQYAQARTQFGAGLFNTGAGLLGQVPTLTTAGYGPLKTQLGLASSIEILGAGALDIGAQLGGRAAQAGANVGNTLLQGGIGAA